VRACRAQNERAIRDLVVWLSRHVRPVPSHFARSSVSIRSSGASRLARDHMIQLGDPAVPSKLKYGTVPVTLICLSYLPTAQNASAVSVEVAKKCGTLTDTAYPFRVPGNPAAGRTLGTAQDVRDYLSNAWRTVAMCQERLPKRRTIRTPTLPKRGDKGPRLQVDECPLAP